MREHSGGNVGEQKKKKKNVRFIFDRFEVSNETLYTI